MLLRINISSLIPAIHFHRVYRFLTLQSLQILGKCDENFKCWKFDRREAEVNVICLLFSSTSCSPKQKSTIVLLYKKIFQLKSLSFRRLNVTFRLTLLHKPCNNMTLRHRLCDITWSDVTIHATFRALRHKLCNIKYCRPHVISLWANKMQFIYSLYNNKYCRPQVISLWTNEMAFIYILYNHISNRNISETI